MFEALTQSRSNAEIVDAFNAEIDDETLRQGIQTEIARQEVAGRVILSPDPAPDKPPATEAETPGVSWYRSENTIEDFSVPFYGVLFEAETEAAAVLEAEDASDKALKKVKSLAARIEAIRKSMEGLDEVARAELSVRVGQLESEKNEAENFAARHKKSVAGFIVEIAAQVAENTIVEIRDPKICARKTQHVIICWSFTLVDLATYEGIE